MFNSVRLGLRRLFRRHAADRELADEVVSYIEMATEANVRRGMTPADAARAARVAFGGVESAKEVVRAGGWEAGIDNLARDVRFAARTLRRNAAFSLAVIATVALGIGASATMFSVVRGVILRPLPYADPSRVALVWTDDAGRGLHETPTAYRTIDDWRAQNHTLADIGYFSPLRAVQRLSDDSRVRIAGAFTSASVFSILGVAPAAGRAILPRDEEERAPVAVISYALWQRRFGGDTNALGKVLDLEQADKAAGGPPRIIGVMPRGFFFPDRQTEFWVPATTYWRWSRESVEWFPDWARRWIAVGRLARSASIASARADLDRISARLAADHPGPVSGFSGFAPHVVAISDHVAGARVRATLWTLFAAVGVVLLIACGNVAGLMLARTTARRHEFAVRGALGAGRRRLFAQLLVESLMLAAAGGTFGVLLAVEATRLVGAAMAAYLPRADEIAVDGWVVAFAAALSVAVGVAVGVAPALRMSRVDPAHTLKDGGRAIGSRGAGRARGLLVATECALAMVLLVGAGLLLRSLWRVQGVDPGFRAENVLSMRLELARIAPPPPTGGAAPLERGWGEQVLHDLGDRIAAIPGVEGFAFTDDLFLRGNADESIFVPGQPAGDSAATQLQSSSATPGFLELLRVPLRRGRYLTRDDAFTKIRALFTPVDNSGSLADKERRAIHELVVVNEAFAKRFFGTEDPIGRTFCVDPTNKTYWYAIVGVVADMHRQGLEREPIPEYFQTLLPAFGVEALVRTRGDPMRVAAAVRQLVAGAIPGTIVLGISTADERLGGFNATRRLQTWLFASFAAVALLLAAVGVFGIVHYTVNERTSEIGVRIALGALHRDVVALVVREGLRFPAAGIVAGAIVAVGSSRLLASQLFGVAPTDPVTFASVAGVLVGAALVASWIPARRAARVDPVMALRDE